MSIFDKKHTFKDLHKKPETYFFNGDYLESSRKYLAVDSVDLIITDPPYGIAGDKLHQHYNRKEEFVIDDYAEIPAEEYEDFSNNLLKESYRVLKPGGSMYLISGWTNLHHILNAINQTKFKLVNHIIWKYNFGVFTNKKFVTSHYHILYLVKFPANEKTFNSYSRFSATEKDENGRSRQYQDLEDVWIISREYQHGNEEKLKNKNQLPSALLTKMIQYSSNEGDVILDFFAGSFSTAKIAKSLNRSSVSFEISKGAFDYQIKEVDKVQWGESLANVKSGTDDRPKNQNLPWSDEDYKKLAEAYDNLKAQGMNKKQAIDVLCKDLERGYFSVLNALKKMER